MINKIIEFLKDKKIAILGFGLEGKSSYRFIKKYMPKKNIDILLKSMDKDNLSDSDFIKANEDEFTRFITGEDYLENLDNYDIILKSPGISFKDIDISKIENKISSQLELFLEFKNSLCIGITGTKGKSTTSSLIYEVIKAQNDNVELLGNIGIPIFDEIERINDETITVIEISSHALQYVKRSPDISLFLNLFEEHLDHYKSFDEYKEAKFNIFKYQNSDDIAIFNLDNKNMNDMNFKYKTTDYAITFENNENTLSCNTVYLKDNYIWLNNERIYNIEEIRKLKGNHNLNNIMFVLTVAKILKLDLEKAIYTINEFNPLEHRLEFVGKFDDIEYYNDSIATIPESTIESVKALENVNTLIVGGNDRGVNQEELIIFLKQSSVENIICLPKTGEYIYEGLKNSNKNIRKAFDMKEAVEIAKEVTRKNTICLLSPAASSYGYFKNFKERGNKFKEYVKGKGE